MTRREILIYWSAVAAAFLLFLWIFGGALAPFLLGAAIAYIADPLVGRLERLGLSRAVGTSLIAGSAFLIVLLALLLLLPLIFDQLQQLVKNAPGYFEAASGWLEQQFPGLVPDNSLPVPTEEGEKAAAAPAPEAAAKWGMYAIESVVSGGLALVDLLAVLVIAPIVAFYLLLDWSRLISAIDSAIPRYQLDTVRKLAGQIDEVLSGFLRGQMIVCTILGTFYAVALTIIGLEYGLLVGLVAGIISFIPYVGSATGLVLSVSLALYQFWGDWLMVGGVAGIFLFGQLVEGNLLSPLLVGERVRLHPVWLIFALSAFGYAFGFPGLLVAVPLAASLGVLARWGLKRYSESELYTGNPEA